jgi:DNA-binding phage protein
MICPKTDNKIKEFYSISQASRETGITRTSINRVLKGGRKTSGGYKWEYVTD